MYGCILVPLDGSVRAERILPHVVSVAQRFRAQVLLLKVDEAEIALEHDEVIDETVYKEKQRSQKEKTSLYLASVQKQLGQMGISVRSSSFSGSVVKSIVETVKEERVGLIALATRGIGWRKHQFYGSTTFGLLKEAPVPILLMRVDEAESK